MALVVELQGLKPWTSAMPWQRSNQLSYSPIALHYSKTLLRGEVFILLLRAHPGHVVMVDVCFAASGNAPMRTSMCSLLRIC